MNIFTQAFEQYSILWLILSGVIGGFIGATVKFLFEQVWSPAVQQKRATKLAISNYTFPLLRAADTLDRRIENFYHYGSSDWYNDKTDDYYKRTTQYIIGSYFGWCRILEQEAGLFGPEGLKFNKQFFRVFKGLTSFTYLKDIPNVNDKSIGEATIPRFALTAIGELMIRKNVVDASMKGDSPKQAYDVLGFVEFLNKVDNADFGKWFGYLDHLFEEVEKIPSNLKWSRILIFATNLRSFVEFLDPKHRLSAPREIPYLRDLMPQVADLLTKELEESDLGWMIVK